MSTHSRKQGRGWESTDGKQALKLGIRARALYFPDELL